MKSIFNYFLLSLLLVFYSGSFLSAESTANIKGYSNESLIIKFKFGSLLLPQVRSAVPANYHDKFICENRAGDNTDPVKEFMSTNYIYSIKAVKPDATLELLAGGIERIFVVELSGLMSVEQVRLMLKGNNEIEYAEFDHTGNAEGFEVRGSVENTSMTPNDPSFSQQWGLQNTGQTVNGIPGTPGGDIGAPSAWDVTTGSPNIIISILDSGIPLTHPEFSGRILAGYDYANNDNDATDDHGHGTNVASVSAAKGNNGSLVAGVNWNAKIIPVKILDATGSGLYSWWVSGITYAVDHGAKVLNMSVGGSSFNQALADAVTYAYSHGRIVVCCMMNNNNNATYYPAGFSNVIAVGAINNKMQRAVPFCWGGGASFGTHIDFTAPGEMILGLVYNNAGSTSYWCGTSQATPMVAGVVSLMFSVDSTLTYTQIYNALKNSARDQVGPPTEDTPGFDNYFGWGLINARGAINLVNGIQQISSEIPKKFSLEQNYPNPFNPVTNIRFGIAVKSHVRLSVSNSLGQVVNILADKELDAGTYNYDWDATNYSSGVYYYTIEMVTSGSEVTFRDTKKMILVK
jgi:thermitase